MPTAFPFFLPELREELAQLRRNWFWFVVLGSALVLIGLLAIAYPVIASVETVEIFGFFLVAAAGVEIVSIFWARRWSGFFLHLLGGLLYLFLGVLLIEHTGLAMLVYTLLLALFFAANGLARIVLALGQRFPGWGWTLLGGVISLLLGILIWRQFPAAAFWVIGTFVGIELLFSGWSWLMLGLGLRSLPDQQEPANPHIR